MTQERRNRDMADMLVVLSTGFKLVGRAFRAFELASNRLAEQYTLAENVFAVCLLVLLILRIFN